MSREGKKDYMSGQYIRSKASFTMMEILIVTGIMTMLVAMLVPAFQQAREAAKSTACMNNQKQIGRSIQMYAPMFDGVVLFRQKYPNGKGGHNARQWFQALEDAGVLQTKGILVCPSYKPYEYDPSEAASIYGMINADRCANEFTDKGKNNGWLYNNGPHDQALGFYLDRITSPSEFIFTTDSADWDDKAQFYIAEFDGRRNYYIHMRHSKKAKMGFADGHVGSVNDEKLVKYGSVQRDKAGGNKVTEIKVRYGDGSEKVLKTF
jgi:prepilin-type processing-associated H-X9-DG protein